MTTVVWHGKTRTFAVDAMGTVQHNNHPVLRNELAYKIVDFYPLKLTDRNGERLLAAAVSGDVAGIGTLLKFLIEALGEWNLTAIMVKDVGGTFLSRTQPASAIVITNKVAYKIIMGSGVTIEQYKLDDFVAIGSGQWLAIGAYRVFGVSARDAVLAASACDENTGFMIMTAQVTGKGMTAHHGEYINDMAREVLRIRNKTRGHLTTDLVKKQLPLEKRFGTGDAIVSIHRLKQIRERESKKRKESITKTKVVEKQLVKPVRKKKLK